MTDFAAETTALKLAPADGSSDDEQQAVEREVVLSKARLTRMNVRAERDTAAVNRWWAERECAYTRYLVRRHQGLVVEAIRISRAARKELARSGLQRTTSVLLVSRTESLVARAQALVHESESLMRRAVAPPPGRPKARGYGARGFRLPSSVGISSVTVG